MKKLIALLITLLLLIPTAVFAVSEDYVDTTADIVGVAPVDGKVTLYLFRGNGCPYCEKELDWLSHITDVFGDQLVVYDYEVWEDEANKEKCYAVKELHGDQPDDGVPYSVIGEHVVYGFGYDEPLMVENIIREYLGMELVDKPYYNPFDEEIPEQSEPQNNGQNEVAPTQQNYGNPSNYSNSLTSTFVGIALLSFSFLAICGGYCLLTIANKMKK